jgi:DcuC family C4-dicarboxylate transporter
MAPLVPPARAWHDERMLLLLGLVIIAITVYAILRRVDVRLALILAALALAVLASDPVGSLGAFFSTGDTDALLSLCRGPMSIVRTALTTLTDEKFVVPICCAMGFAHVLRHTGCDQHLVHLLVRPLLRVRPLLIPGAVLVGYAVNIPVVSQTSTAVTVGCVLIPLLLAARLSPVTVGAALLLGSSIGGELFNPGAPELRTVIEATQSASVSLGQGPLLLSGADCVQHIAPLNLIQLGVCVVGFWVVSARAEARAEKQTAASGQEPVPPDDSAFRVNWLRAAVPLVPLVLLFFTGKPIQLVTVPTEWLVKNPQNADELLRFDSRLIGTAMLAGVAVAVLVVPRAAPGVAAAFFEGAGHAFTHIISVIVAASCFGEAVKMLGLAQRLGEVIQAAPALLLPMAGLVSLGFAWLCGSGMASTQSLFGFFAEPALRLQVHPAHVGAVVSLASAAGRTISPVAAVNLMCATLTKTSPVELVRRLAVPVLLGVVVMVVASVVLVR